MNFQLVKKNISRPLKRYNMSTSTAILFQEVHRYVANYKIPLLIKIYWYGIFWATFFGGCYGCKQALADENNDVSVLDATRKKAFVAGTMWLKLPIYTSMFAYHYVKFNIE